MSLRDVLASKRESILRTAARYGASNVRVFGSAARGTADAQSDVDLLVDLEAGRSLLDLGALSEEFKSILGCNVDVVTENGLRARIRKRVLEEAVPL